MSSRDYTRHTISSTQPTRYQVGDEYYDPATNLLYKCVAVNGTAVSFVQLPLLLNNNLTMSGNISGSNQVLTGNIKVVGGVANIGSNIGLSATVGALPSIGMNLGSVNGSYIRDYYTDNNTTIREVNNVFPYINIKYINGAYAYGGINSFQIWDGTANPMASMGFSFSGAGEPTDPNNKSGSFILTAANAQVTTANINGDFGVVTGTKSRFRIKFDGNTYLLGNNTTITGNVFVGNTTTITYQPATAIGVALTVNAASTLGGAGYADFLKVVNSSSGATNPNKTFRMNNTGNFEIINSLYTTNILTLTDTGNLTIPGVATVGNITTTNGVFWANGIAYSTGGGSFNGGTITGALTINNSTGSTSTGTGALIVGGGIGVAGNVWAGQVYSTNNGNGTNFAVGDDAWFGDINIANTTRLMGQQDGTQGYLVFGNTNSTNYIGRTGSNPITVTGAFTVTGNAITGNLSTTTASATNFVGTFTGTSAITSGSISGVTGQFSTLTATNFSTANAVVTGGSLNNTTVGATTATTGRFTTIVTTTGTNSTSNVTGALQVTGGGGVGVSASIYVGNRVGYVWAGNSVSSAYTVFNSTTGSIDTVFG